jgi:hypothetical protein
MANKTLATHPPIVYTQPMLWPTSHKSTALHPPTPALGQWPHKEGASTHTHMHLEGRQDHPGDCSYLSAALHTTAQVDQQPQGPRLKRQPFSILLLLAAIEGAGSSSSAQLLLAGACMVAAGAARADSCCCCSCGPVSAGSSVGRCVSTPVALCAAGWVPAGPQAGQHTCLVVPVRHIAVSAHRCHYML